MDTATLSLGGGSNTMVAEPIGRALWTTDVLEFVEAQQEKAYRRLADELGLDGDARAAHAQLATAPMGAAKFDEKSQRAIAASRPLPTGVDRGVFNDAVRRRYGEYFDRKLPTPFEDPTRFPLLEMLDDQVWEELARVNRQPKLRPVVATMPTGDVNARIARLPATGRPIVFIEQGLFAFLNTMSVVAAWSIPEISADALDDRRLAHLLPRHTFPPQAPRIFLQALLAYAIDGSVERMGPIPKPQDNLFIAMALFAQMQRFALAHEFAHLRLGHLDRPTKSREQAYSTEYEADLDSLDTVTTVAREFYGAWSIGFWGAELALCSFNFLDRVLGILAFGPEKLSWISPTHPQPLERRKHLHDQIPSSASPLERAAAVGLYRMDQAIFQRLWEMVSLDILLQHKQGQRPSPIWKDRLERSLRPNS